MSEQQSTIATPLVKLTTAWAAVGVTSWADFASMLAALYTFVLLGEWCWKKFGRRWVFGEYRNRRKSDRR